MKRNNLKTVFGKTELLLGKNQSLFHDLGHRLRVLILTAILSQDKTLEKKINKRLLLLAAFYHDIGRKTDFDNRGHGKRSAKWVRDNLPKLHPELTKKDLERVAILCQAHALEDGAGKELSLELAVLKDADALDRVRFGFWPGGLREKYLRTEAARSLLGKSIPQKLASLTKKPFLKKDSNLIYAQIWRATKKLKLPISLPYNQCQFVTEEKIQVFWERLLAGKKIKLKSLFPLEEREILGSFYKEKRLLALRKLERQKLRDYAYEPKKIETLEKELLSLSRKIASQQRKTRQKLLKNRGEIIASLQILVSRFPQVKELRRDYWQLLNLFLQERLELGRKSFEKAWRGLGRDLEEIEKGSFAKLKILSLATKLEIATKIEIENESLSWRLAKLLKKGRLKSQKNRLAIYRWIITLGKRKSFYPELAAFLKEKLLDRSKPATNLFLEKEVFTLTGPINPYVNFYYDQKEVFEEEVWLLVRAFGELAPEATKLWDKQLLPILLNRDLGDLALLEKMAKKIGRQKIINKWLFLKKTESKNRQKGRPYYKTVLAYFEKHSQDNLKKIFRKLDFGKISEDLLVETKFDLCINVAPKNLVKIINGEGCFYSYWNTQAEETKLRARNVFLETLVSVGRINNYKEVSTLIRQPNRSYDQAIYGYMRAEYGPTSLARYMDAVNKQFIRFYGSATIFLKEEARKKAIFSLLDTAFVYRERQVVFEEAKKLKVALDSHLFKVHLKHKLASVTTAYLEAKYLGGVKIADFEKVRLTFWGYLKYRQTWRKLIKIAPGLKIEVKGLC